jgi:hypothetical protein
MPACSACCRGCCRWQRVQQGAPGDAAAAHVRTPAVTGAAWARRTPDLHRVWRACLLMLTRARTCTHKTQIIVADTFTNLAAQYMGPGALLAQRPVVLLAAGLLVMVMCFPRDLRALGERATWMFYNMWRCLRVCSARQALHRLTAAARACAAAGCGCRCVARRARELCSSAGLCVHRRRSAGARHPGAPVSFAGSAGLASCHCTVGAVGGQCTPSPAGPSPPTALVPSRARACTPPCVVLPCAADCPRAPRAHGRRAAVPF